MVIPLFAGVFVVNATAKIFEDDEGQEFPRLEMAEAAALKSGRELLSNNIKYASDAALEAVIVANDRREEILRISVKDLLQGRLK